MLSYFEKFATVKFFSGKQSYKIRIGVYAWSLSTDSSVPLTMDAMWSGLCTAFYSFFPASKSSPRIRQSFQPMFEMSDFRMCCVRRGQDTVMTAFCGLVINKSHMCLPC